MKENDVLTENNCKQLQEECKKLKQSKAESESKAAQFVCQRSPSGTITQK